MARSLARGRTGNLGIVVPDMANSFSAIITKAVQQEARRDGYALFVAGSDELPQDEEQWARAMAAQVDGLLLVSPLMPDAALRELAGQGPLVRGQPAPRRRARGADRHHRGHRARRRAPARPRPPARSSTWPARTATRTTMRLRGYREACARLGIEPVELGPFQARFAAGVRAADLVLAAAATAVVAYNDEVAVGVINRLADRGVRVPDDMSVVGFDDTSLAGMVTPRLTTVRLPMAAAGQAAVAMLLDLLRAGAAASPSRSCSPANSSSASAPARRRPNAERGGRDDRLRIRSALTRRPPRGRRGS